MAPVSHDTLVKQMKAVKRLSKLEGKSREKVAGEIAARKEILLAMEIISVERLEELLFLAELVRGTNWKGQIAVSANIDPKTQKRLLSKAKDHNLEADAASPHYKE